MLQDLRYGFRILLKNRGFTLIAIITLAFGNRRQHGDLQCSQCPPAALSPLRRPGPSGDDLGDPSRPAQNRPLLSRL